MVSSLTFKYVCTYLSSSSSTYISTIIIIMIVKSITRSVFGLENIDSSATDTN